MGRREEIARVESPRVGISEEVCLSYFCDHLRFCLAGAMHGPERFAGWLSGMVWLRQR